MAIASNYLIELEKHREMIQLAQKQTTDIYKHPNTQNTPQRQMQDMQHMMVQSKPV
jgi:hypothetical protein